MRESISKEESSILKDGITTLEQTLLVEQVPDDADAVPRDSQSAARTYKFIAENYELICKQCFSTGSLNGQVFSAHSYWLHYEPKLPLQPERGIHVLIECTVCGSYAWAAVLDIEQGELRLSDEHDGIIIKENKTSQTETRPWRAKSLGIND